MSDQLERLENALRASTPAPSAAARARAMDAAKAAFEIHHQGNRQRARQKGQVSEIGTSRLISWLRRFTVPASRPALALAGAAFVVVASVVFYQSVLDRPALSPDLTTVELADPTDSSASLPAAASTSQLRVEPASPPADSAPPEMERIREAEVAEVMERIASQRLEESLSLAEPSIHDQPDQGRDRFSRFDANPVKIAAEEPVSTFSIDVDTASYGFVRAALQNGTLPQQDAVRTEELVNYFPYDYAPPDSRETPFAVHVSLMPAPWIEANRLLHVGIKGYVAEATSTLFPIAEAVKIQVEFNPALVSEYRLIGYETRMLKREDFRNDKVDAGEIGVGHTVTAIYELTPVRSGSERIPPLRYQEREEAVTGTEFADEVAYLKIRYKLPDSETSTEMVRAVTRADAFESVDAAPRDARFAAAVAAFGQLLRGGQYTGDFSYDDVIALAQSARGADPFGYRTEFVGLVRLAQSAAAMAPPR